MTNRHGNNNNNNKWDTDACLGRLSSPSFRKVGSCSLFRTVKRTTFFRFVSVIVPSQLDSPHSLPVDRYRSILLPTLRQSLPCHWVPSGPPWSIVVVVRSQVEAVNTKCLSMDRFAARTITITITAKQCRKHANPQMVWEEINETTCHKAGEARRMQADSE